MSRHKKSRLVLTNNKGGTMRKKVFNSIIIAVLNVCLLNSVSGEIATSGQEKNKSPKEYYLHYLDAIKNMDLQTVKSLTDSEYLKLHGDEMKQEHLQLMSQIMAKDVEVISEKIDGNKAEIRAKGSSLDISTQGFTSSEGTIIMINENGIWKMVSEKWQVLSGDRITSSGNGITQVKSVPIGEDIKKKKEILLSQKTALGAQNQNLNPQEIYFKFIEAKKSKNVNEFIKCISSDKLKMYSYWGTDMNKNLKTENNLRPEPENIEIVNEKTYENGNSSVLELKGLSDGKIISGRATLVRENGGWEVHMENWENWFKK